MTYKQLENGEHLTIHNATKEQLKWMVKDAQLGEEMLYKELTECKKQVEILTKELYKYMLIAHNKPIQPRKHHSPIEV